MASSDIAVSDTVSGVCLDSKQENIEAIVAADRESTSEPQNIHWDMETMSRRQQEQSKATGPHYWVVNEYTEELPIYRSDDNLGNSKLVPFGPIDDWGFQYALKVHTTEPPFLESELRVVENQLTSRDRPLRWNSQPSQTPSRCLPDENIQPVLVEPILPPVQDQGNSHITDIGPHDNRSELAAEQHGEIDQTSWRPLDGEDDWPPYTFGGRTPQPPSESSYWSDRSPYHTGYPDSFNFEPFVEAQIPFNDEHHDSRTLGYRSTSPGSGEGFQDGNEPTGSSYQPNPSNHEELYMSNEWENLSNASTLVSPPSPQTEPTQPTTSSTEVLMPLIDSNDETANTALSTNLASHVAGRPRPMRWALSMSTADVSYSPNGDGSLNWSPSPDRPQPEHYAVPLISPYFLDEDEIPVWLRPHGGLLQQARDDTPIEQSVTETSTAHHAPAKKESGQEKQTSLETNKRATRQDAIAETTLYESDTDGRTKENPNKKIKRSSSHS